MLTSLTPAQKVVLAVGVAALMLGVVLSVSRRGNQGSPESSDVSYEPPAPEPAEIRVHVTGEVLRPGLYRLTLGARVEDAVQAAGGFKLGARESSVNLAAFVEDGDQVFVDAEPPAEQPAPLAVDQPPYQRPSAEAPQAGSKPRPTATRATTEPTSPAAPAAPAPARPQRVQLNSAGLEELQQLPGIGPELAKRILYYRYEHGRFRSLEDLAQVDGIGPQTIEKIRAVATLN